jgi:hypothetical protein
MLYPNNRSSLTEKIRAYDTVRNRFDFLNHLEDLSISELHTAAEKLIKIYNCPFTLRLYWGRKSSYLQISCPFVWVSEATRPCNKSNFKSCWVDVQGPV